jgi:NitT/TauT family transport system permease protein
MNAKRHLGLVIGLFALSMLLWEMACRFSAIPNYILPAPSEVFLALYKGLSSGLYLRHGGITLMETLLGFVIGTGLGLLLGTLIATYRLVDLLMYPYIVMFQSMPKVALAPIFALWLGLGVQSKIFSAAIICFFPLMVNTIAGLRSADEDRVSLMRSLGASRWQVFIYLRLPGALPFIMAGLELAVVLSLIGVIVAEFVGAEAGLGTLIQTMNFNMDIAGQFSVLLVLSMIGLVLNRLIKLMRRRVLFWDPSEKARQSGPNV